MLKELFLIFTKLGFLAFGGPAAHIAMMHDEVVVRRGWYTEASYMDMIAFTNLLPGPNSTEMAILIGYTQAKFKGLLVAGLAFIMPAVLIVLGLTAVYTTYNTLPEVQAVLRGLIPILVIIIFLAVYKMGIKTVNKIEHLVLLAILVVMTFLNVPEIIVLLSGALYFLLKRVRTRFNTLAVEPVSLVVLFMTFLKIGAVLYGSGYVLISFIQTEFVEKLGWLTSSQLIDLIAIGEITPGPIFTTATAVGYFLGGISGSIVATLGIFVPSFLLIGILFPVYEKIKKLDIVREALKGVSIAGLAIMVSVVLNLGWIVISDISLLTILLVAIVLGVFFKLKPTHLLLIGAIMGYFAY